MFEFEVDQRPTPVDALDADGTLTRVSSLRAAADVAEWRIVETAAHWADLNGAVMDRVVLLPGAERLVQLGGEGTPEVAEFAPAELAAELSMSPAAGAGLVADALDLRHRLPLVWADVQAGRLRVWMARKIAQQTRPLTIHDVAVVDAKVASWAGRLDYGRLTTLVEAAIIAADPAAADEAARDAEISQGVWVGSSNDHGIKDIYIRAEAPVAIRFDAQIDRIADALALLGNADPKDMRRAQAVGILTDPQQALNLFAEQTAAGSSTQVDSRPKAVLHIHIDQTSLSDEATGGVARVEEVGPVTVSQAQNWLGHCDVVVKPVIDLNGQVSVDAYEVPDRIREVVLLRTPTDVFPYATNQSRRMDLDHTIAYTPVEAGGPPGQTGTANLGPMTRFHHRAKTHTAWTVQQPYPGIYVWKSPHGRYYLVDHTGTRRIDTTAAA